MNKVVLGLGVAVVVLVGIGGGIWVATRGKALPKPAVTSPALSAPTTLPLASPATETGAEPTGLVREFTVVGSSFKFSPATITVKKGETVRLSFKSRGPFHNLVIDEFDAATSELGEEEEEEVEFVADKTGTFEYYCSVGNHRAMGMVGKLVVE